MENSNINQIQNQYPSVQKYVRKSTPVVNSAPPFSGVTQTEFKKSSILFSLNGNYPSNFLDFEVPDINDIEIVENTTFGFVILIKNGEEDSGRYFTSDRYYSKLEESVGTNNPYFVNFSLKNIIVFDIKPLIDLNENLVEGELSLEFPVGVSKNVFINKIYDNPDEEEDIENFSYEYNYEELVRYIDWIVGDVIPFTDEADAVLPTETILDYIIQE